MKILMLHNFYQQRGGEGVSFAAESEALRELGHEVDTYTVDNATDLPTLSAMQLAMRSIWSLESYRKIRSLLLRKPYDILHVQNFFPLLSPSVYDAARSCGVPVVQALRNYRLFCMQGGLFRDGKLCEDCVVSGNSFAGIRARCYRSSLTASVALGAFQEIHRHRKTWKRRVDAFIAVSECVKDKYVAAGWDSDSIFVKHNTVMPVPDVGVGQGGFFAVVGRLSDDKGLFMLIDSWEVLINRNGVELKPQLKIIGDGPLLEDLKLEVVNRKLVDCIQFTGALSLKETYDAMGAATATIQPSVRYEPCSRTIAESYAKGTPVIAAKIGGAVELVEDGETGFHFPAGDPQALADAVCRLQEQLQSSSEIRIKARAKFERDFSPRANAEQLTSIYADVLSGYSDRA